MSYLIKVYHSFEKWKKSFQEFLDDVSKTLSKNVFTLWVHYTKWEICYSLDTNKSTYSWFESQFYTHFNDFQITKDNKDIRDYDKSKTIIWEISLYNNWFYPFKMDENDDSDFISNLFRTFENFDVINDKIWFFIELRPIENEKFSFFIKSKLQHRLLKQKLVLNFYKYLFSHKTQKNRKAEWDKYFKSKLSKNLFYTKIYIVAQSQNKESAEWKIKSIFNNFLVFKNYPLNHFTIKTHRNIWTLLLDLKKFKSDLKSYVMDSKEISSFFHFPKDPKTETALFTVKSRKLALPVWVPSFEYSINENWEVFAKEYPQDVNIIWISDYRSITVPIWIYDEDRLRHVYVVWKTWTGKSKFLLNLMINDIQKWKWIWIIDPHGDAIEEIMTHIPESRKNDVIIFDPTDSQFPFCINPLDVKPEESKQILAKWFIDIFKKFFGSNWNPKLEHVLRMIFLALLDKPKSTLFDIIRALTDKDFRYEMIDAIEDDVVRNFWTNEFAGWSQQFNTEAIMPILNKVWQLLSIDIMKNIFASPENKLDLRKVMDESKILLIKLPKWKLQEEIMWFLWAMFVTKLFQTAIGRQSIDKNERVPFFLYVDEFQNFATDTFNEILSEARKYWLSLSVAHQFIRQIPKNISDALFGNVWTLISFRISSEDAEYMKQHFQPFLNGYDLANLNMREFYCKLLVKWQVKDPFSLKSCRTPDVKINKDHIQNLYEISRSKYSRPLEEAKKVVIEQQWDVMKTIEEFAEPII